MSHFTEIKSQVKNLETLKEAAKALNLKFDEGQVYARGFYGDKLPCDFKIETGTQYDIGLRKTESGTYEFVADWDMLKYSKFDSEAFRNKLLQRYSYIEVKTTLEEQGYEFENEEVDEKGAIQMRVSRW